MKPGDPTGTFCDWLLPESNTLFCGECGRQIPETRDQWLAMLARSIREIDHRLDDLIKALARNASTKPASDAAPALAQPESLASL